MTGGDQQDEPPRPAVDRRRVALIGTGLLAVALAGVLALQMLDGDDGGDVAVDALDAPLAPGGPPPQEVEQAVTSLSAADGDTQRSVLSPELVELLEESDEQGTVLPPGAAIELDPDGWRSEIDGFGAATGRITGQDGDPAPVEVGFMEVDGSWLVTYIFEPGGAR